MQEKKRIAIDEAIDGTRLIEKLSVRELMELFGPVKTDADGDAFIYVEDDLDSDSDIPISTLFSKGHGTKARKSTRAKQGSKRSSRVGSVASTLNTNAASLLSEPKRNVTVEDASDSDGELPTL